VNKNFNVNKNGHQVFENACPSFMEENIHAIRNLPTTLTKSTKCFTFLEST
jgi:hypothetical protein